MSKPRAPSAASAAVAATVSPSQSMVGDATSTPLSNWALVVKNGAPSADLSLAARRTLNQIRTEWLQRTHTARGTHGFAWLSKYVEVDLGFPVHVISRSSHRTIAIVGSGSETESFIAPARASDAARCSVDASAAFVTLATLVPRHHRSPEHVWHQVRALQRHFTLSAHQAARNPDAEYDDNGGRVSLLALAAAVLCGIGAHCLSLEECARLLAEELEYLLALSVTCNGPDQQHWDQQTRRTGLDEYSSLFHEWAASANAATQLAFNKSNASMNSDSGILDLMVRQGTAATQSGSHASANILNRHSSNTNVRRRRNSSIFPMSFDATSGAVPGPTTASSTSLSPDHANRPSSSHHSPPNFNSGINGPTSSSAAAAAVDGAPVDWRRVQWTCLLPPVKGSRAEPLYHLLEARRHDFIPPSLTYVVASSYAPESPRAGPQRTPSTSGLPRPSSSSSVPRQSSPSHSHSPPRPSSSGDLVTPRAGSSSHLHGLPPAHSSGHHHQHQQQSAFETMVTAALSSSMILNANSANTEGGNRSVTPSEWRDAVTRTATCVMLPGIPSTYLVKNYVQHLGFDARYRFRSTVAALAALAKDYDCGRIGSDAITPWSGPREYSLAISAKLRLSLQLPLDRHCVLLAPYGTAQQPVAGVSHGLDDNGSARTGTGRTDGTEVHHRRGLTRKDTEGSIDPEMASSWEGSFGPGGRSGIGLGVGSISIQDKGETDHVDVDDDSESIYDQETKTIPRPDRGSAYTRNRRGEGTVAAGVDVVGPTGACCGGGCLVM